MIKIRGVQDSFKSHNNFSILNVEPIWMKPCIVKTLRLTRQVDSYNKLFPLRLTMVQLYSQYIFLLLVMLWLYAELVNDFIVCDSVRSKVHTIM